MKSNPVTVYWAPSSPLRSTMVNLAWGKPQPLFHTLPKKIGTRANNYRACTAATSFYRNTYVIRHCKTIDVKFSGDVENPVMESTMNWWNFRPSSFEDTYAVDYDFGWFYFSEEDVTVEYTPPYMHKTETQNHGYLTAGSFNIGRWFRPLNLTHHLWPNNSYLKFVEGEPAAYMFFKTPENRPVVLKQFQITEEISKVGHEMVGFKDWMPMESLETLYQRFTESGSKDLVLKLIEDNLLE